MTAIDQKIEELGAWASGLELSAADPSTPYWMRQQDAERAKRIREQQVSLLEDLKQQAMMLGTCSTPGCPNRVAGMLYCSVCEDAISGQPYPLANVILGETFVQYITRLWDRISHRA